MLKFILFYMICMWGLIYGCCRWCRPIGIPVDVTEIHNKFHTDCEVFSMTSKSHGIHLLVAHRSMD